MKKKSLILPVLAFISFILTRILAHYPSFVESYYAEKLNPIFIRFISRLTGLIPLSLAEIIIFIHVILIPIFLLIFIISIKKQTYKVLLSYFFQYLSIIYILFVFTWGFNYYRTPINELQGFDKVDYAIESLDELSKYLINEANQLRQVVNENKNGVFYIPQGKKSLLDQGHLAFDFMSDDYPYFQGQYGPVKGIYLSKPMLYTGITGFYFPFTGEANVNMATIDLLFPATILHEIAHQRGFAPEDEANFIAFLSSRYHPDPVFQYSGTVLALIYSQNALYKVDPELAIENMTLYDSGLKKDLQAKNDFWKQYDGIIDDASSKINDTYLKSNQQSAGVKSYSNMVNWVLAYYQTKIKPQ